MGTELPRKKTDRQTYALTSCEKDIKRQIISWGDIQTDIETDRQTKRLTDRQKDRQTDIHTDLY